MNTNEDSRNAKTDSHCLNSQRLKIHAEWKEQSRDLLDGCLNVCGLKRRALYPDFSDLIRIFYMFCAVETKLDSTDVIPLQGYQFIICPRKQSTLRRSGGIGVYIKTDIASFLSQTESNSDYITWLKISKSFFNTKQNLIVGVCYIPPQSSKYLNDDDFSALKRR